jgi:hypothetical protein
VKPLGERREPFLFLLPVVEPLIAAKDGEIVGDRDRGHDDAQRRGCGTLELGQRRERRARRATEE